MPLGLRPRSGSLLPSCESTDPAAVRRAAQVSVFAPLVAKAALASSSLGSGITQYLGVGFLGGGGTTGMADTWSNAQAYCNVRRALTLTLTPARTLGPPIQG